MDDIFTPASNGLTTHYARGYFTCSTNCYLISVAVPAVVAAAVPGGDVRLSAEARHRLHDGRPHRHRRRVRLPPRVHRRLVTAGGGARVVSSAGRDVLTGHMTQEYPAEKSREICSDDKSLFFGCVTQVRRTRYKLVPITMRRRNGSSVG